MAKNKLANQETFEEQYDFDFEDMMTPFEESSMGDVLDSLITASNHQLSMAMDLTKLVLTQQEPQAMTENQIIDLFRKAVDAVVEGYPFKKMISEIQ